MESGWGDFLVAAAGATAALAGLVFVALSINLTRILELPGVPRRAGEAIILLASGLVGSLTALVPGQGSARLGLWLLLLWLPTWLVPTYAQIRAFFRRQYYRAAQETLRFVLYQAATLPLLLAALSLRGHLAGGLSWFAASLLISLMVSLFNAWILLVEILR